MNLTRQARGSTQWNAPWPLLVAPAARLRSVSRVWTVSLIFGLSALLWELVVGAVRLLIAI